MLSLPTFSFLCCGRPPLPELLIDSPLRWSKCSGAKRPRTWKTPLLPIYKSSEISNDRVRLALLFSSNSCRIVETHRLRTFVRSVLIVSLNRAPHISLARLTAARVHSVLLLLLSHGWLTMVSRGRDSTGTTGSFRFPHACTYELVLRHFCREVSTLVGAAAPANLPVTGSGWP